MRVQRLRHQDIVNSFCHRHGVSLRAAFRVRRRLRYYRDRHGMYCALPSGSVGDCATTGTGTVCTARCLQGPSETALLQGQALYVLLSYYGAVKEQNYNVWLASRVCGNAAD